MNIALANFDAWSSPNIVSSPGASTAESATSDGASVSGRVDSTEATGEGATTGRREGTFAATDDSGGRLETGTVGRATFDTGTTISNGSPCWTGRPSDAAGGTSELVVGSTCGTGVDGCCCAFGSTIVVDSGEPSRTGEMFWTRVDGSPRRRGDVPGCTNELAVGSTCWVGVDTCPCAIAGPVRPVVCTPDRPDEIFHMRPDVPSVSPASPPVVTSPPALREPPSLMSLRSPSKWLKDSSCCGKYPTLVCRFVDTSGVLMLR